MAVRQHSQEHGSTDSGSFAGRRSQVACPVSTVHDISHSEAGRIDLGFRCGIRPDQDSTLSCGGSPVSQRSSNQPTGLTRPRP
jgi:hypothetical protein